MTPDSCLLQLELPCPNHPFPYTALFISSASPFIHLTSQSCRRSLFPISSSLSPLPFLLDHLPASLPAQGEGVKFMVFALENVSHLPLTSPLLSWLTPNPPWIRCICSKWWTRPLCLPWPKEKADCKLCGISHYDPAPTCTHPADDLQTFLSCI